MRLFVAVDLPEPVKDHLETLRAAIPGATWVKRPAFHLTLRFLGDDIPAARLDDIRAALVRVEAPPFELALRGLGRFPAPGRRPARVLWVGVDAPPALQTLYRGVSAALNPVGFPADGQPFSAHITLARLRQPNVEREVERFQAQQAGIASPAFPVSEFILYSSELTQHGSLYTVQATFPLR